MLDDAKLYLITFLRKIGCSDISFSEFSYKQIIGFDCASFDLIHKLYKTLNLSGSLYKRNNHYIFILTNEQIIDLLRIHFNIIFNQWKAEAQIKLSGHAEANSLFSFDDEKDFYRCNHPSLQESLQVKGLVCKERKYTEENRSFYVTYDSVYPTYHSGTVQFNSSLGQWETYHSIVKTVETRKQTVEMQDMKLFFDAYGKSITDKIIARPKQIFLQGFHPKNKHASPQAMKNNPLYESKLLPHIFSYVGQMEPSSSTRKEIFNSTIESIEAAIHQLDEESKTCYFFTERKLAKIDFLKLILKIKASNPAFSDKSCVNIAITEYPKRYKQAIKGLFSERTFRLIEAIRQSNEVSNNSRLYDAKT